MVDIYVEILHRELRILQSGQVSIGNYGFGLEVYFENTPILDFSFSLTQEPVK